MREQLTYRNHLAEAFGMDQAPTLVTNALRKSTLAVTELRYDRRNFGMTAPIPIEDAYLIGLQFRPCPDHDLFFDGRYVRPAHWFPGALTIYDLRQSPIADIRDPYHSLMFHLPRAALDTIAYESGTARVGDLHYQPGLGIDDPAARHLLSSLLPATARPAEASALFLDHVALALAAHIAHIYGGMKSPTRIVRGGLSPHQERRVKELMAASLTRDITLLHLAAECGLSTRHFARAFRQSTGLTPHRWLMQHRVEHARRLLANRALSLTEVALACGFADQSHFTRAFTAAVGITPGAFRRASPAASRR
ncbi:MAG TPA: AraC family transcriptional regulator [Acidobacteriaceae bacterium]|nr:AraC family transcriptional regulator [Acidobacteriaceae bacterium]